jgi:hypothetical protein
MGQHVWLMNPSSTRQKVAVGIISGIGGQDKFHCNIIPDNWFKIGVGEILVPEVPLMWENASVEQTKVGDVRGSNALWDHKHLKVATP